MTTTAYRRNRVPGPVDAQAVGSVSWFAAFSADDLALSDGGAVSTWADRSGNARDASQGTSGNRPTYRATVAALNSKPAVEFDGSNDFLRTSSWTAISQPISVVAILSILATGSGSRFIADGISSNPMAVYWNATVSWAMYAGTSEWAQGSPNPSTGAKGLRALLNGTSSRFAVNGTVLSAATNIGSGTMTGLTIGAKRDDTGSANMQLAFLGLYAGDVTADGNWSDFKAWAASYYGVTVG